MLNRHTRVGALLLLLLLFFVTVQPSYAGSVECKAACAFGGATCVFICEEHNLGWPCAAACAAAAAACSAGCDLPEPDPDPQT